MKTLASIVAFLALSVPALAATHHVPGDFPDVQSAINAASPDDTIVVHGGLWGSIVIDRPLHLLGDPGATFVGTAVGSHYAAPITLAGPGTGTVILSPLHVSGDPSGYVVSTRSPGIQGTGFSELHVYDSMVFAPEWAGVTGLALGHPGIEVTIPFVLVERSGVCASGNLCDNTPLTCAPDGRAGIEVVGTVAALDAVVYGGGVSSGTIPCYCFPDMCPGAWTPAPGGVGGNAIECTELIHANVTFRPGEGCSWQGGPAFARCTEICFRAPDGVPIVTSTEVPLANDLQGSGPMYMGTPYPLTWSTPGPIALLYMSLGIGRRGPMRASTCSSIGRRSSTSGSCPRRGASPRRFPRTSRSSATPSPSSSSIRRAERRDRSRGAGCPDPFATAPVTGSRGDVGERESVTKEGPRSGRLRINASSLTRGGSERGFPVHD